MPTEPTFARATKEAERQGFSGARTFQWDGGSAWWFPDLYGSPGSGAAVDEPEGFAAYVGTVHWKGLTKGALLRTLLARYKTPAEMPLDEFSGSFAMLYSAGDGVWLFNDAVGLLKIYQTDDERLFSTSFMVCRSALATRKVNRLRAQEYVLFGANHGLETPIRGIRIADPARATALSPSVPHTSWPVTRWRSVANLPRNRGEALELLSTAIRDDFRSMVDAYGADIGMALSGGFDSRLMLAALDGLGVEPKLYVYGAPGDIDVQIASVIAKNLGTAIECIDKGVINAGQPQFGAELLTSNLSFFDGIPVDGVFDAGADRQTRLLQVQGGRLNLNGGGGEVFRNFFYLPDRRYSASALASVFYSNWLPDAIPDADDRIRLSHAMEDGMLECLGRESGSDAARNSPLARAEVELVYSLFRLRYWMGRNNSVSARYGAFLTPLPHPKLVALTAALPMKWKNFGALEAEMIKRLSPRVASGPSAYGFEFANGPSFVHRLKAIETLARPVVLRKHSAVLRRLIRRNGSAKPPRLPAEIASILPDQDWIATAGLTHRDQFDRLHTLQAVLSEN
ncbi:asparagine synthase [Burkholderiales bacterium GJ-E10]|nr:asparagine synthase [Burkholderiales bacterium GJ-E10]